MLQFIFGRALSGKTTFLLNKANEYIMQNKDTVIIVPEQSSFDTEKKVLKMFGDKKMSKINVTSFSRLCDEVEFLTGGLCGKQITDSGKLIIMNRALRNCAHELLVWKRYINYSGFISSMLDSIEEFKLNYILPDDLLLASDKVNSKALSLKLQDIAIIYKHYTALLNENFIDPTDRLTKLYERLLDCRYFENKTVFIDSFKSFTGQQYRIIERIISQSDNVYIALTNDPKYIKRYNVFENIRNTVNRIKRIASSHNINVNEDVYLSEQFYKNDVLKAVENLLFNGEIPFEVQDEGLYICRASTNYDEAEFTARNIRRLVREEGYRYRDFVIIARDIAPYEEAIIDACNKNNIACFIDKRRPLAEYPPVIAVLAAINCILSFSTEQILRFCKCGLNIFSTQEISLLENYTYIWNIKGNKWLEEWNMNPAGLVAESNDDEVEQLKVINELRCRVIIPLTKFRKNFCGDAKQRAKSVFDLLNTFNAKMAFENLSREFAENNELTQVETLRQSWDMMVKVFEDLHNCFGNTQPDNETFCTAFKNAVQNVTVGVAPQMLDEVSFGSADRIRPSAPKVAFILGANQGVFPAFSSSNGLLGISDREKLISAGIDIPDKSISNAIDEEFLVYTNLSCATEKLFICYSTSSLSGEDREASAFVSQIANMVPHLRFSEPDELTIANLPETVQAAFSEGCLRFDNDREASMNIFSAFDENNEIIKRIENIISSNSFVTKNLLAENAQKLYGNNIPLSATKLDTFNRCKFQFFCKYGIKAKKIQPADFDVLQRGTIIHYVLQRIVEENIENYHSFNNQQISDFVDTYVREYLSKISGYNTIETSRMSFLVSNISRSLKEVACQIRDEFAQSQFKPVYCEFKFGIDDKPPIKVAFEGGNLLLNGSIDRVDVWNGYVRVIDYKSGSRTFKLPDILVGQNLQMLLYLYALKKSESFSNNSSAGIFYMPSKRDRDGNGLAMNGLMPENEELVKAMDCENSGRYIMKYALKKDGTLSKNAAASFVNDGDFEYIFEYIEKQLKKTGEKIINGCIDIDPIDGLDSPACKYCDFAAICGIENTKIPKTENMANEQVMEKIREAVSKNGVQSN